MQYLQSVSAFDASLRMALTVVLIVGGYQFYFYCQRQKWFEPRCLQTRWDSRITYDPRWFLVYSVLYYPMIVLAALLLPTWNEYAMAAGCFLMLLAAQMAFFLLWPTDVPAEWRTNARIPWEGTWGQRCMDLVWSFDKLRNSCPSMHVSMAMMTDLTIWRWWPEAGVVGLAFPVLIAISAVKTKQHYIVDVVPGAALGAAVFWFWNYIL